jgi:RNA methyltransferase, TrmH family
MLKHVLSLQHPLVKHLVKLRKNSNYRHEHQTVVIEGTKLVNEICRLIKPKMLVVCDQSHIPKNWEAENVILVSEEIFKKISGLKAPEGILAEISLPKTDSLQNKRYVIALDGINDPGNMGALLRTALALGWEGAFILEDSCDPYNEKAIRSARGATFHLPMASGTWNDLQIIIDKNQLYPLAADINGKTLSEETFKKNILLVLGNEARGLSIKAQSLCEKITIPMSPCVESLNVAVAGGILMYTLRAYSKSK